MILWEPFLISYVVWRLRSIFYTILPLNDNEKNSVENLNDKNYKRVVKKLHDDGWKNGSITSADVAMLGHGCGVS